MKNEKTMSELSARFGVHPTVISNWKRTLLDNASVLFDKSQKSRRRKRPRSTNCSGRSGS
jgi:transposase